MHMTTSRLAYSHLNLRFNPFGELDRSQRAEVAVIYLSDLQHLLLEAGTALQFVADHGRGKSTHLLALHAQLPQYSYTQVHSGDNPRFEKQDIQFVDSVENLSRFKRSRLYKRSRSIALTTHQNLYDELKKAGYHVVTKQIALRCPEQIAAVLNRRILFAQRDSTRKVPLLTNDTIQELIRQHGTDIRQMENQLYEIFQDLKEVKDV